MSVGAFPARCVIALAMGAGACEQHSRLHALRTVLAYPVIYMIFITLTCLHLEWTCCTDGGLRLLLQRQIGTQTWQDSLRLRPSSISRSSAE